MEEKRKLTDRLPWRRGVLIGSALVLFIMLRWGKKLWGLPRIGMTAKYPHILGFAVFLAIVSVLTIAGVVILLLRKKGWDYSKLYLVCGFGLGILYLFTLPFLSAPDERVHYITACSISSEWLGWEVTDEKGCVLVQEEDMTKAVKPFPTGKEYEYFWSNLFGKETGTAMVSSKKAAHRTLQLSYYPQAAGITLARVLGLNYTTRLFFGRLFNLIWSVLIISLALKIMPFGKKILFGTALLPMTLHELASNSYDVWVLAWSFLFVAYCLWLAYEKEKVTWKDVGVLAIVMGLLAPCKMVYAPLVGLCLLIPIRKFGNTKKWIVSAAVVLICVCAGLVFVNMQTITHYTTVEQASSYVDWAEETGYSMTYLLENPGLIEVTFRETLDHMTRYYIDTLAGWRLGQLDMVCQMSDIYLLGFLFILLGSFIPVAGEKMPFRRGNRVWILFLCAVCSVGVLYSMLIAWTPLSEVIIQGVQGRYFIPMLPVAAAAVVSWCGISMEKRKEKQWIALYIMWHLMWIADLFAQILMA